MVQTVLAHPSLSKPERAQPQGHLPVQEVMSSLLWLHPDPLQVSHTGPLAAPTSINANAAAIIRFNLRFRFFIVITPSITLPAD